MERKAKLGGLPKLCHCSFPLSMRQNLSFNPDKLVSRKNPWVTLPHISSSSSLSECGLRHVDATNLRSPILELTFAHWFQDWHLPLSPLKQVQMGSWTSPRSWNGYRSILVGGYPPGKYGSQLGWFWIYGKLKNVPNHQPVSQNYLKYLIFRDIQMFGGPWM